MTDYASIGSYTHAIALPPERAPELEQTLSLMAGIGYIDMAEGDTPVDPDLVLIAPFLGRPTCMTLPAALAQGAIAKDLARIAEANATFLDYHRGRRQTLATG